MRISFAVHPTGHTQVDLWAFAPATRGGPYTAFSQFYTGVRSVTSGNFPSVLTGVKQEMQADGVCVENIFSSNLVTHLHPTDTSHFHTLALTTEANAQSWGGQTDPSPCRRKRMKLFLCPFSLF